MKAKEIRRRTSADLLEEVKRLGTEAFDSRFKAQSEEKTDRGLALRNRREVARIRTILRERELGLSPEPSGAKAERAGADADAKKPARKKKGKE
jgi:large subunit ribosomal protein L29